MNSFGIQTWNLDVLVECVWTVEELLRIRIELINFLGMDMADMAPQVNQYPIGDGRGGVGVSIYQPFVESVRIYQALTTSFIIFDAWPEHKALTVTLKSCVKFDTNAVMQFIQRSVGRILDLHSWTLSPMRR